MWKGNHVARTCVDGVRNSGVAFQETMTIESEPLRLEHPDLLTRRSPMHGPIVVRLHLTQCSICSRFANRRNRQKHKHAERKKHDERGKRHFDLTRTGSRLPLILPKAFSNYTLNLVSEGADHTKQRPWGIAPVR